MQTDGAESSIHSERVALKSELPQFSCKVHRIKQPILSLTADLSIIDEPTTEISVHQNTFLIGILTTGGQNLSQYKMTAYPPTSE